MNSVKKEETTIKYPDLDKMCRLCFRENSGTINIFDPQESLVHRIMTCTSIEIQESGSSSKHICETCRIDLEKFYYFRKRSQMHNNKLKKHLRLINAGKISYVFEQNAEIDDDEYELVDSIKFLQDIKEKENQAHEEEFDKRLKEWETKHNEELENIRKQMRDEIDERMDILSRKHQSEKLKLCAQIKCLKKQHELEMQSHIVKMIQDVTSQVLNEIKDFVNIKLNENQTKRKFSDSDFDGKESQPSKMIINNERSIIKKSSQKISTTEKQNKNSVEAAGELINMEFPQPEKIFKICYVDDNGRNEETKYITEDELNDEQCKTSIAIEDEYNMHDQSNIEIIETAECNSDYDTRLEQDENDEEVNENEKLVKTIESADDDDDTIELGDEQLNEEHHLTLIESNILLNDERNLSESLDSQETIETNIQQSHSNQEMIDAENNMEFDSQKTSDFVTKVKLKTKAGNIILMETKSKKSDKTKSKIKQEPSVTNKVDAILDNLSKGFTPKDAIKIFRCKFCPQAFSREALLIRHKKVHNKRKGYTCDHCGKWLACRSSLNRHIRVHTGEKPFSCDECGRDFIQKEILKRHLLTHTGERPYKCPHCDKSFVQKLMLRQHINLRHSDNPIIELHACHLCPKTFMHASGLSRHLTTHSGIVFICSHCGKVFCDKSALKRHTVGIHGKCKPNANEQKLDDVDNN